MSVLNPVMLVYVRALPRVCAWCACCMMVLGVPRARAGGSPTLEALLATLDRVPEQANFIVGVPDGEAVLGEMKAEGESLIVLANALEQASGAWKALADALNWDREDMTVALMGGSVVLMGRAHGMQAELAEWTLRCTVTPETEARLTGRLELFPRRIVEGQPVFSVENGRYVLALRRAPQPQRAGEAQALGEARTVQLFVAPADEGGLALFEGALRAAGQGEPLPGNARSDPRPAVLSLRALGPAQAVLLVRDAPEPGAPEPDDYSGWGTHRVVSFSGSSADGTFSMLVRDRRLERIADRLPVVPPAALAAWSDGAAVAFMLCELPDMPGPLQPWLMGVLGELPLEHPHEASARVTLWSARPRDDGLGLAVQAALQAPASAASARVLDGAIESIMSTIESLAGAQPPSWEAVRGLCDVAPTAAREVRVSLPAKGYGAQLAGAESMLRWGVISTPESARLGRGWDGWLAAGLGPLGTPLPSPPTAPPDLGDGRRWVCRAVIRVPLLMKALPTIMPIALKQSAMASRVGRQDLAALTTSVGVLDELAFESWLDPAEPGIGRARLHVRVDVQKAAAARAQRAAQPK